MFPTGGERCNTPSSALSHNQPDLIQSYYANRNMKPKSSVKSTSSSNPQSRNVSHGRSKDPRSQHDRRSSAHVPNDSFSSEDDSDQDDEDSSDLKDVDELLRSRHHAQPVSLGPRPMMPMGASNTSHFIAGPMRPQPGNHNYLGHAPYAKPKDQGETSV